MKRYKIKATALSPIHIGTGEVYEPTNYIIDDGYLYSFREEEFYKRLSKNDKRIFLDKVSKNRFESLFELWKFISSKKAIAKEIADYKVKLTSGVEEHYNKYFAKATQVSNRKNIKEFNQFLIEKSIRNVNFKEFYIPGSSIKGSVLTAYMEYLNDINFLKTHHSKELLISDSIPKKVYEMVGYALNKEKFENDLIGPKKFMEVIFSNHTNKSIFEFDLSLKEYEEFNHHIQIEELKEACNNHYYSLFKEQFENEEINKILGKNFKNIYQTFELKTNQFLLKVGKHSGAKAVTIENFRKILVTIALIQNKRDEGNDASARIQRLYKKSNYESDELENLMIDFGRLNDKEKRILQRFEDFYYEPEKLIRLVESKKRLTIKAILKEETTSWIFGFGNKLKENGHLPFGWLLCEIVEEIV